MRSDLLPLFVTLPLLSAFLVAVVGKRFRALGDLLSNVTSVALFGISCWAVYLMRNQDLLVYRMGGWAAPIGICLVADALSVFLLVVVNLVAMFVNAYAVRYMDTYTSKERFHTLFLLMMAGMNGVVVTGDLFNLFVFLEIASLASYSLVAFGTEQEELEASFKYAVMGSVAAVLILLGIAVLYAGTSTLTLAGIADALAQGPRPPWVLLVCVLFLVGFGLKAALVPFHWWLPDAHPSAPAPISAMMSGLLIKTLGIYVLARLFFNVFGYVELLPVVMALGVLSMLVGVILAVWQRDLKRLLAYSSISQVGYIALGLGLGTPLGIAGGLLHLLNHSVFKSLLFLNSGAVVYATGTRDLHELGGLRQKMPVTAGTSMVASLSIAGVPPFNGFWSKLLIVIACVQAGHHVYALWAVLTSVLTLATFMKVQKYVFFGRETRRTASAREAPFLMKLAMVGLAVVCVFAGLLAVPRVGNAFPLVRSAAGVLSRGTKHSQMVWDKVKMTEPTGKEVAR